MEFMAFSEKQTDSISAVPTPALLLKVKQFNLWNISFGHVFLFFLTSLFVSGYSVLGGNHPLQLALVQKISNPALFPGDPFVDTLSTYSAVLWYLVAIVAEQISLDKVLLFGFLFERLLVIYAAGRLAQSILPNYRIAQVGSMAIFAVVPLPILGDGSIVGNNFEQTGLAMAFFILAMAAFYRKDKYWWAFWMALGFNSNSLYGIFASTYFLVSLLSDANYRLKWNSWVSPFTFFLLLSLPVFYLSCTTFILKSPLPDLWLMAAGYRFPHHLHPLSWKFGAFARFFLLFFLVVLISFFSRHRTVKISRHAISWALVALGWLILAFVAAYLFKSPSLLILQPGRGPDIWYACGSIAIITCIAGTMGSSRATLLHIILLFALIIFWIPKIHLLILFPMWLIARWGPVWKIILKKGDQKRLATLIVLAVFLLSAASVFHRIHKGENAFFNRYPVEERKEIADWATNQTPISSCFLIDPTWINFRILSLRPVYFTWKDGAALLWHRPYVNTWIHRLESIGFMLGEQQERGWALRKPLKTAYENLTDEGVMLIKKETSLHYWIVAKHHESDFPTAYQSKSFKVLAIP